MNLAGQTVSVLLTEDGRRVLSLAAVGLPEADMIAVTVEESEDMGLWIKVPREDRGHLVLLRWEYVLTIDTLSERGRVLGLRR